MDIATAAFWLFLTVVIGSLIWRKTILRRETLATLRVAIDRSVPLDDTLVQALLDAAADRRRRTTPVSGDLFLVLGMLFVATALSLGFLALFAPEPPPIIVLAFAAAAAAGSFLTVWRIFARRAAAADNSSMLR